MNLGAITHFPAFNYAFPLNGNRLLIRLKAAKNDLKEVIIIYGCRYTDKGKEASKRKKLKNVASDNISDYFETTIELSDPRFRYIFYLDDGNEHFWFNEKGFSKKRPYGVHSGYFQYPCINDNDIFEPPDWVQDSVFYQIFPDRFSRSNKKNIKGKFTKWGQKPESNSFFGGDLNGITERLDYLKELGINAIYLTPVFQSPSNHKYNIDDYYKIDPDFGNKNDLKELVQKAHSIGIRIIMDAVFNHVGYNFFAFKDVRIKGGNSEYKDWFKIESYPVKTSLVNYQTFARDIPTMPKIVTSNPEVIKYFTQVGKYWIKEVDIDGWRLDVADEVDHRFWRKFREEVKSVKPEAYIVGEIWYDAQKWLQGDQFDAIMNYNFASAIYDFFARGKIGPILFDARLSRNRMHYHPYVNFSMLNLLDSHDTPRMLSYFNGNKKRMKLAIIFQMTYIGAPMVFYGDEVGLNGSEDPDCRRCMIWEKEKQDLALINFYKKLISIRYKLPALRRGKYRTLIKDEIKNIYGFKRIYKEQNIIVLLNNSENEVEYTLSENIINKEVIKDYLTNKNYIKSFNFKLHIGPYQGMILG